MRKVLTKVIAVVLSTALCFSMLGCSKSSKDSSSNSGSGAKSGAASTTENPYAKHLKISIALWGIGDMITDPSKDAVLKKLEDKFNVEIVPYAVTWGDYTEKIKLWAASNNLPDVTAYEAGFTDVFDQWTKQGIVRALPSDVSKYSNINKLLTSDYGKKVNEVSGDAKDAKYYGVPRPSFSDRAHTMEEYGVAVRKDWMEKVGVTETPDNLDDFISLLKKFQTEDPDGNGKDDTIGLTGYTFAWMTDMFMGTCPGGINGFRWVYAQDGTLEPVWKSPEFLEGMKALKKMYDAGVLDPDYIIIKGEEGREKFEQGKAGAYAHSGPELEPLNMLQKGFKNTYPDKKLEDLITFLPIFADSKGEVRFPANDTCWSETYLSSKVSDEKAERIMAIMDYLLSDEGYKLISLGIKGTDYTEDASGKVTLIPTKKSDGTVQPIAEKYPSTGLQTLTNWMSFRNAENPNYDESLKKMSQDYYDAQIARGAKEADLPITDGVILQSNASYDTAGGNFQKLINDLMTSKDIDKAYQDMVNNLMKSGYDKVIKEFNELYNQKYPK